MLGKRCTPEPHPSPQSFLSKLKSRFLEALEGFRPQRLEDWTGGRRRCPQPAGGSGDITSTCSLWGIKLLTLMFLIPPSTLAERWRDLLRRDQHAEQPSLLKAPWALLSSLEPCVCGAGQSRGSPLCCAREPLVHVELQM